METLKMIAEWVLDGVKGFAVMLLILAAMFAGANLHQPMLKYQQSMGIPTLQQFLQEDAVKPLPSSFIGDLPVSNGDRLHL